MKFSTLPIPRNLCPTSRPKEINALIKSKIPSCSLISTGFNFSKPPRSTLPRINSLLFFDSSPITSTTTSTTLPNHDALITKTNNSSFFIFPQIFRRSFHTYNASNFHSSKRSFKYHSSEHIEFQKSKDNLSSHPLLNLFDNPNPFPTTTTRRENFIFNHGASGIPKHADKSISTICDEEWYSTDCGEDSFFRRHDSLGVADGVGGWRNVAPSPNAVANSAIYSRKLMHYAYAELEKYDNIDDEKYYHYNDVNPIDILQASYDQCMRDCTLEGIVGSSTALIAILRNDELRIANLGDCGICIIRHNSFIFRNEEQQHSFNYPFQLGSASHDNPKDSQTFTVKIQCGDIVVMGSDGIFDNLFDEDILDEVVPFCCPKRGLQVEPQIISDALVWRAKTVSEDLHTTSPFQSKALSEGLYYQGGKKDDISCLVGVVTPKK
ncbi:phosphatase 2C-like domain-containing protein [Gigaspora rosea]|uniref:Protein phosphatase n=1 Tax=Gigaspora rosea TaxID=44941 RepID=A0A397V0D8_9GLOM|nr:phosphatase 2C-like domain-containing protein [Gigaspora rosea]